ncbi:MAG TPA: hypothetical protein VGF92_09860 [Stellaceae bacterium]|jgi:hypothetical protein
MRHIASVLTVTAAISLAAVPFAHAQGRHTDSSSQEHVQQHQDVVPPSSSQNSDSRDQPARDQAAQAPQSPAVITPPSTGDKSVITPPARDMAKTPVITPPGAAGNKDEIQPK